MIEIQNWEETIIQKNSATVIASTNFNMSFCNVTVIDLKMRRQTHYYKFQLENKPTKLFQVDSHNLFVGTENGKIEHLDLSMQERVKTYDAHPESVKGVSSIIEIHSKSPLLRGPNDDGSFRLIATASEGAP
jgi:hypothetical protein